MEETQIMSKDFKEIANSTEFNLSSLGEYGECYEYFVRTYVFFLRELNIDLEHIFNSSTKKEKDKNIEFLGVAFHQLKEKAFASMSNMRPTGHIMQYLKFFLDEKNIFNNMKFDASIKNNDDFISYIIREKDTFDFFKGRSAIKDDSKVIDISLMSRYTSVKETTLADINNLKRNDVFCDKIANLTTTHIDAKNFHIYSLIYERFVTTVVYCIETIIFNYDNNMLYNIFKLPKNEKNIHKPFIKDSIILSKFLIMEINRFSDLLSGMFGEKIILT